MTALPYIISFLTGLLLLQRIMEGPEKLRGLLIPLSFGLGAGCSSLLTFYSLFICTKFSPGGIVAMHIIFWTILFVKKDMKPVWSVDRIKSMGAFLVSQWPVWLTGAIVFHFLYTLAHYHPFGEWDAWAVWNLKTKFITEGAEHWKNAFRLHWHTQPDYPWLLPCLNAWGSAFTSTPVHIAGQITAVLLSTNTVLLLLASLQKHMNYFWAFLAAALLATCPVYTFSGTSQYADIVLAHYLLMALITLLILIRENDIDMTFVLGITLGILSFAKNEGLIITLIFAAIIIKYFFRQKGMIKNVLTAYIVTALAAVIFKFFLAPPNRDISLTQMTLLPTLFSFEHCGLVFHHFFMSAVDRQLNFIWIFLAGLLLWDVKKYRHQEHQAAAIFFILYAAVIFLIYLSTSHFDLSWRLSRTAPRILSYLLPSALYMGFYTHWQKR